MRIRFCPKCKGRNITPIAGGQIGMFICEKCKFNGSIFPEIEIDENKLRM